MLLREALSKPLEGTYLREYQNIYKIQDVKSDGRFEGIRINCEPDIYCENILDATWYGYLEDFNLDEVEIITQEEFNKDFDIFINYLKGQIYEN